MKKPGDRPSVFLALLLAVGAAGPGEGSEIPAPPNIVLILADDMGYECVKANGGTSYETPVLDGLAAAGMRFEHCYSQPICTPSRVQLMTGIYNQRNYIRFGILDPQAVTFAQILRKAGYRTCVAGKWQLLGGLDGPGHFGFDEYCLWQLTVRKSRYPNPVMERQGKIIEYTDGEYGPDVASDFIVDFMRRQKDAPFLVYYPMILPHWPFEPTPDSADWDPKARGVLKGQGDPKYFAGMVKYTDKMVGKVIRALDELGLRRRTLVLFTGDNGTAVGITSRFRDRDFPGGKGKTTDAGTHVPFIASWPGTVPEGKVCRDLVDFSDFLPTLLETAGVRLPDRLSIDGRSFLPQLQGRRGTPREWIYCWYSRNGGPKGREYVRDQRFKLYGGGRFFDVASDDFERNDLGARELGPEARKARETLEKALDRFRGTRKIYPPERKNKTSAGRRRPGKADLEKAQARLEALGGHVFWKEGRLVEVSLNRSAISDETLRLVGGLPDLTDLSLEETTVGDRGVAHLKQLAKLEWLNLYRTRIGDAGLYTLSAIPSLKLLPVGETRVTDAGLKHVARMRQLEYLGLRGDRVSDAGLRHVAELTNLEGLHLGGTKVTDRGLKHLGKLGKLEKLWLDDTKISDRAVPHLERLTSLRELHVARTRLSEDAIRRLAAALPACRVFTGK